MLYGPIGAQCTWDMHTVLSSLSEQQQQQQKGGPQLVYALRPVLLSSCQVCGWHEMCVFMFCVCVVCEGFHGSRWLACFVDILTLFLCHLFVRVYVCQVGACAALGSNTRVLLPGYGVEAVLKNTEYSAMDEKDRDAERKGKGSEEEADEEEEDNSTVSVCGGGVK